MSETAKNQASPPEDKRPDSKSAVTPPPLPDTSDSVSDFRKRISRLLTSWRFGLWGCAMLRILVYLLLALLLYALADFFLALENRPRTIIGVIFVTFFASLCIWKTAGIFRCGTLEMARRADRLANNRRQATQCALELLRTDQQSDMSSFLVKRSVGEANQLLSGLSTRQAFPGNDFRRRLWQFIGIAGSCALLTLLLWSVASVLLARMARPWKDIPPYSPLAFVISPEIPEIFYGEDATITVEISGGNIREPIRFLTRSANGPVFETLCFQDGPGKYAQRLERVVQATEFCFAHGRARSQWHHIDLLLEPKVALASCTITPPAYSRKPEQTFLIGEEALAGLKGSQVKLTITSNRPMLDGILRMNPAGDTPGEESSVTGKRSGPQSVSFEWTLQQEGSIDVSIRDLRGTANKKPFRITQKLTPDRPPKIRLTEPPLHLMATPSIKVPIAAKAEDDLGLGRVELVRTVVGYRDRMQDISPLSIERRFDYKNEINLSTLGVSPGETLEFYLETSDRNPNLLGVAASEIARVQIISEEEYANIIRTRTTVKEFAERFQVVNEALRKLRESLQEMKRAVAKGDPQAIQKSLAKASEAASDAARLFELLSQDFAAFDLEKQAIENAAETLRDIQSIEQQLSQAIGKKGNPGAQGKSAGLSQQAIEMMLTKMGVHEQNYQAQQKSAEQVAAVARLMELAAAFSRIIQEQDGLTRRLKKFEYETRTSDLPFLNALGEDQHKIRQQLDTFIEQMEQRISELPYEYEDLAKSAGQFLQATRKTRADRDMNESSGAAKNQEGQKSWQYSALALEKLNALLEQQKSNAFAGMCQGKMQFKPPGSLKETLQQMLSSIRLRNGSGIGSGNGPPRFGNGGSGGAGGGGSGIGGNSEDGYSMGGYTSLDIPVIGPPRMRLRKRSTPAGGDLADGDAAKGKQDMIAEVNETDRLSDATADQHFGQSMPLDQVPVKYRAAVKRYFSPDDSSIQSDPSDQPDQPSNPVKP